jgi:ABC-type sugar transport system ATPase subunit
LRRGHGFRQIAPRLSAADTAAIDSGRGLVVEGLSKTFPGGVQAVARLSLAVAPGEVVVLAGPSGCGKTTTLRLIAGLEQVTAGQLWIEGRNVTRLPPHRRGVAMMFQEHVLYPHLTVGDNLRFGLSPAERRHVESSLSFLARTLAIEGLSERFPDALSGGQRQRVALARALARRRPVTLLDEPLSNVDQHLRIELRRQIKELTRETGTSMVYVTHDQAEAMALADRLVVMNQGRLEQADSPRHVYARPANRFVAQFLALWPIAFLRATVRKHPREQSSDAYVLEMGSWRLAICEPWLSGYNGQQVELGIRAEAICEASTAPASAPSFVGRVVDLQPQGDWVLACLAVGGQADASSGCRLVARFDARRGLAVGGVVQLALDTDRLLWFSAVTGQRLSEAETDNRSNGVDQLG